MTIRSRGVHRRYECVPAAEAFERWEHGGLDSGGWSDLIHRFHQGPARELFLRYNTSNLLAPVAYAIAAGIVDRTIVLVEQNAKLVLEVRGVDFHQHLRVC